MRKLALLIGTVLIVATTGCTSAQHAAAERAPNDGAAREQAPVPPNVPARQAPALQR